MAACPHSRGRAFFDSVYPVVLCRNVFWFMAVPSVGRRSRQRQGVAPYEGIENGGLDLFKAAVISSLEHDDCLLSDGFFSFAVVRQIRIYIEY